MLEQFDEVFCEAERDGLRPVDRNCEIVNLSLQRCGGRTIHIPAGQFEKEWVAALPRAAEEPVQSEAGNSTPHTSMWDHWMRFLTIWERQGYILTRQLCSWATD